MKEKIVQFILEAISVVFGLFGAFSIVLSLMAWINPAFYNDEVNKNNSSARTFLVAFIGGSFCILISLYCSHKAKRLNKK
jgi:ABC-type phosphate transport system permease subunit